MSIFCIYIKKKYNKKDGNLIMYSAITPYLVPDNPFKKVNIGDGFNSLTSDIAIQYNKKILVIFLIFLIEKLCK